MTGDEVLTQGVIAVTRNLLADPKFVAALAHPPEPVAAEAVASVEKAVYSIPGTVPPKGGMAKNSTMLCAAVVTVETSAGTSGSGFYISREGYLITNQHVVGDAGFVKSRTATGLEMPGEVLMTDAMRDVALVKTQKTAFDPLALHLADPNAGDEVFAIGSPLGDQFNGTVTHGVVSGFREIAKRRFLQSDVSITHGNSGGPLVDANGAVIGITKGFLAVNGGNMNFFIPIGEALAKLSIEVKAPEPAPASPPAPALKGKSKAL